MLKFTKTRDVKSPARANETDCGIDFFVPNDFPDTTISHGEAVLIPAGIKVDVPHGWGMIFMNKSGVAAKRKLDVGACVVDPEYSNEVHINLINIGKDPQTIKAGEKIVQALMLPIGNHKLVESDPADMWIKKIGNRDGGFGSTGTN